MTDDLRFVGRFAPVAEAVKTNLGPGYHEQRAALVTDDLRFVGRFAPVAEAVKTNLGPGYQVRVIKAVIPLLDDIPTSWYVSGVPKTTAKSDAKGKLLAAALSVIRMKGYSATSVDELCAAAGVTKGAFFHHFKTKEELAVAAADHWSEMTGDLFASAPYHDHADALDRVLAYVEFRKALLQGGLPDFTCLVGTMVQETYATAPAIRDACERCITGHARTLEADIVEALCARNMKPDWSAKSLALHMQAVIQGAFILAKAADGAEIAAESIDHLRRYIEHLFARERGQAKRPAATITKPFKVQSRNPRRRRA